MSPLMMRVNQSLEQTLNRRKRSTLYLHQALDLLRTSAIAIVWVWVVLVIGFDVSHVWSTLFRTYLDKDERKNHRSVLLWAPLVGLVLSFAVSLWSVDWFWRGLAYTALYHFVKQQYGFLRLYMAKFGAVNYLKIISDGSAIYVAMLYPIVFWHLTSDRVFSWFVTNDFLH